MVGELHDRGLIGIYNIVAESPAFQQRRHTTTTGY
jgi:hypothetical protein